jgi:YHS domain-containing protein
VPVRVRCPRAFSSLRTVASRSACPRDLAFPHLTAGFFQRCIENMNSKSTISILTAVLMGSTFALADSTTPKGVPKDYPLKKCVVSGDPLGEHGKVVKVSYEGTDIYLCCKDCMKDFKKDPAKYARMVKDARAKH